MIDGGGIGLIFAATGFVHCVLLGVPLVMVGRARGWLSPETYAEPSSTTNTSSISSSRSPLSAIKRCSAVDPSYRRS